MKKITQSLAFFLLFSSIILPVLPVITVAQDDTIIFKRPTSSLVGDWDPAITDWYNALVGSYLYSSLEYPIGVPSYDSAGVNHPVGSQWEGILVTDWEFELWPEENNSVGFNNTGGYKSTTLTLRDGVKFTDGSDWNATVFKWNIDRVHLINGNYTGAAQGNDEWEEEEGNLLGTGLVEDNKPYFTASWNLSQFDSPNLGLTPPAILPKVTDYASYNLGPNASLVEYPGVNILPNNTVQNPTPYGGWDTAAQAAIHYAPYDRFPGIDRVEILENKQSGGKIKVYNNFWETDGLGTFVNYPMISYHTYKDHYTVHGIYGYDHDVITFPNPVLVDHMVGTGPYIFQEHDETGTPPGGYMLKNENYWNKTALEADDLFQVDRVEIIKFPAGELGRDAQNTALLTHAIDYSWDSMFQPLDYDAIISNPNIRYEDSTPSEYKTNIVMNAINETWWAWPGYDAWRRSSGGWPLAGNETAGGVPQAMRKAMSFAFNYDLMIGTVLNDRAVRNGGILGVANLYYNDSVGIADYNVTKAREILLTTETDTSGEVFNWYNENWFGYVPDHDLYNFSKMCADRGLDENSTDADWQFVAENNPIYTFNFYWDSAHQDVQSVLLQSLKDIGVALSDEIGTTNKVTTIIWDTVRIGHLTTFDGVHSLFSCGGWVMDEHMPHDTPQLNTFWHYVDPDRGRWRGTGSTPGSVTSYHYWGNYGFNFDAEVDLLFDRLATSSPPEKKKWFSAIADIQQNEKYGVMFLYEAKEGWALWNDWDHPLVVDRNGNLGSIWGGISNHLLQYVGLAIDYPLIPGSPLLITLTVSAVSMIGIVFTIIRKKRLR
jgi:ABC-type transport system substrate-binding protein